MSFMKTIAIATAIAGFATSAFSDVVNLQHVGSYDKDLLCGLHSKTLLQSGASVQAMHTGDLKIWANGKTFFARDLCPGYARAYTRSSGGNSSGGGNASFKVDKTPKVSKPPKSGNGAGKPSKPSKPSGGGSGGSSGGGNSGGGDTGGGNSGGGDTGGGGFPRDNG